MPRFTQVVRGLTTALLITVLTLTASPVAAEPTGSPERPDTWFVELHGAPTASGGNRTTVQREQSGFREVIRRTAPTPRSAAATRGCSTGSPSNPMSWTSPGWSARQR